MDCKRLMNVLHLIEGWRRPPHPHSRSLRWLRCSRLAFHWPDCWPRPHWPSSPSRSSCTCPSPCGWRGPWRKRRRSRTGHTWSRFLSLVVHLRPVASPDYHHYYGHYCLSSRLQRLHLIITIIIVIIIMFTLGGLFFYFHLIGGIFSNFFYFVQSFFHFLLLFIYFFTLGGLPGPLCSPAPCRLTRPRLRAS